MKKIRLFIAQNILNYGDKVKIDDNDFLYLTKVMRQKIGDQIFVFNGISGEFKAEITAIEKKFLTLNILEKNADLKKTPNITLAFAPVKNVGIDFIAKKATELGISSFQPIITNHTIVDKINQERFRANIKEALEQCERNDSVEIYEIKKLEKFFTENDSEQKIFILCDESGESKKASTVLGTLRDKNDYQNKEIVVLIGPEGGFSKTEFLAMRQIKNLHSISLGPRILRADTAMIAALTLVQEFLGDF